jgi:hypothetical protein
MKRKRFDGDDIPSLHKRVRNTYTDTKHIKLTHIQMRQFAPIADDVDEMNIDPRPAPTEAQLSWATLCSRHTSQLPTIHDPHDPKDEL